MIAAFLPVNGPGMFPKQIWERLEKQNAQDLTEDECRSLRDKVRLALSDMHKAEIVTRKPETTAKGGQSYQYTLKVGLHTRSSPCLVEKNVFGRQASDSAERLPRSTSRVTVASDTSPPGAFCTGQNAAGDNAHVETTIKILSEREKDDSLIAVAQSRHGHHIGLDNAGHAESHPILAEVAEPGADAQCEDTGRGADAVIIELGRQVQRMHRLMNDDNILAKKLEDLRGQRERAQAALVSIRSRAHETTTSCASLDSEIKTLEEKLFELKSRANERRQDVARLEQDENDKRQEYEEMDSRHVSLERRRLEIDQQLSSMRRALRLDFK